MWRGLGSGGAARVERGSAFCRAAKIDWAAVFEREYDDAGRSAEEMLYGGGFVPDSDYRAAEQAMDAQRQPRDMQPNGKQPNFKDARLVELWWLYRARHFPHTFSADEQARWHRLARAAPDR